MSQVSNDFAFFAYLNKIDKEYNFYTFIVVINLGLIGNVVNILIFTIRRRNFSNSTMGFYNLLMSACNIFSLITAYVYMFPVSLGRVSLVVASNLGCPLLSYFIRIFFMMSSWLSVMVTFDRMVCVTFPTKILFISDKKRLSWIAALLFVVILALSTPNLLFRVENLLTTYGTISKQCVASASITAIRDLIGLIVRFIMPIGLETVLNIVLIYKLIKHRKSLNNTRDLKREYRFAFTIALLNVLYFVFEVPTFVITLYLNFAGYNHAVTNNQAIVAPTRESAIANLVFDLSLVFASFRFTCLFYVNFFVNKMFRREFMRIFVDFKSNLSGIFSKST